jgi:hypothetical protein
MEAVLLSYHTEYGVGKGGNNLWWIKIWKVAAVALSVRRWYHKSNDSLQWSVLLKTEELQWMTMSYVTKLQDPRDQWPRWKAFLEECSLLGCDIVLLLLEPTFWRNVSPPSSLILSTLMMEVVHSLETFILLRATQCHIPENGIHHSHCSENLRSYIIRRNCGLTEKLQKRWKYPLVHATQF